MSIQRYSLEHGNMVKSGDGGWIEYSTLAAGMTWAREDEFKRITQHDRHSGLACWTNFSATQLEAVKTLQDLRDAHVSSGRRQSKDYLRALDEAIAAITPAQA